MKLSTKLWGGMLCVILAAQALDAQAQDAKPIVQQAVNAELAANHDDNSHWRYLRTEAGGNSMIIVETENGAISRHVQENGKPVSAEDLAEEDQRTQKFIHDTAEQKKQRANGAHDDKSAVELLNLLPQAFLWKVVSATPEATTLHFDPDPNFHPPDMEARVMGQMSGTMVVERSQHRIRTFKGMLGSDVTIGFGLLARIKQGSTFDVERRQVSPAYWEITETHVHISGHALFFKTIGEQEDEVKTEFTLVPLGTTLEQAVGLLRANSK
ncbi:MAG TPA: hypothetical protein VMQ60_12925 [Acidobacteriaceae bacterium]|jgi:hypothetical protein|nr:hypothetical protein [Acidobacteriaceae bacterium]